MIELELANGTICGGVGCRRMGSIVVNGVMCFATIKLPKGP